MKTAPDSDSVPSSPSTSHPFADPESPPSYDTALASASTANPFATEGSSIAVDDDSAPKGLAYLFEGPKNAEPLLGRSHVPIEAISAVRWWKEAGKKVASNDPRLADREWARGAWLMCSVGAV